MKYLLKNGTLQVGTLSLCQERGSTMAVQSRKSPYRGKVRERWAMLAYVKVHGAAPAAQRFGLDRKTVRTWRGRVGAAIPDAAPAPDPGGDRGPHRPRPHGVPVQSQPHPVLADPRP